MKSTRRMLAAFACIVVLMALQTVIGASGSYASSRHFSDPGTTVTASLAPGSLLAYTGSTVDGVPVAVTCTTQSASAVIPTKGLTVLFSAPSLNGCTTQLGTSVNVRTTGTWKAVFNGSGTKVTFIVPKDNESIQGGIPGCVITSAPSGPVTLKATYSNSNTITIHNDPYPESGTGCTTGGKPVVSATMIISPNTSVV